ncbi:MAG: hypothetical protein KAJ19_22865 [Gammaproteobacteria bacterium]|nr:hypothetical protein [Gammaproteobacteria bacterium]
MPTERQEKVDQTKQRYLNDWADHIVDAAHGGHLTKGKPISISQINTVAGPRAGALEMLVGRDVSQLPDAGRLLQALSVNQCVALRQLVPWEFSGSPVVFTQGRYLRAEAGWNSDLAETMVKLRDVAPRQLGDGRWYAGKDELGRLVTLSLDDKTPHYLLAGMTGSGKSVGLLGAICQLGVDRSNHLMIIDGKGGLDYGSVSNLPTLVGPLVIDAETAKGALLWAVTDMKRRYEQARQGNRDPSRLIIFWDEPQAWLKSEKGMTETLDLLLSQGRAVGVHVFLATHNPKTGMFGDGAGKRNIPGRIALLVDSHDASRVAVGKSQPRADLLHGTGDGWLLVPDGMARAQLCFVDQKDFDLLPAGEPLIEDWPEFQAEHLNAPAGAFSGVEAAVSILAAQAGKGRPAMADAVARATGNKPPGGPRGSRLLAFGREASEWYRKHGLAVYKVKK